MAERQSVEAGGSWAAGDYPVDGILWVGRDEASMLPHSPMADTLDLSSGLSHTTSPRSWNPPNPVGRGSMTSLVFCAVRKHFMGAAVRSTGGTPPEASSSSGAAVQPRCGQLGY
jgi:hypothetical protein